ncbi:MAG: biotin/lipoyl-containing protein, partial [Mycobacterium sp.]
LRQWAAADDNLWSLPSGWRTGRQAPSVFRLSAGDRVDHVRITGTPEAGTAVVEDGGSYSLTAALAGRDLTVTVDGLRTKYVVAADGAYIWLAGPAGTVVVHEVREAPVRAEDEHSGDAELLSPMPGSVVAVGVTDGATVDTGAVVVTVEAMKMEHALSSPVDGVVELLVAVGDQVKVGQPLARIIAATKEAQE